MSPAAMVTVRFTGPAHNHARPGGKERGGSTTRAEEEDEVPAPATTVPCDATEADPLAAVDATSPQPVAPGMGRQPSPAPPPPPPPPPPETPEVRDSKVRRIGNGAGLCARSVIGNVVASFIPAPPPTTASVNFLFIDDVSVSDEEEEEEEGEEEEEEESFTFDGPSNVQRTSCKPAAAAVAALVAERCCCVVVS